MRAAALVEAIGKLSPEIANQAMKCLNLGSNLLIVDFGHAIGGFDRTMRRSNRQNDMTGDRPNGVGDLAFDHEDISGAGGENLTPTRDGALPADHDEEMVAGVRMRHEPVTGGEPDDVGGQRLLICSAFRRLALGRAMLAQNLAGKALRNGELRHDMFDAAATAGSRSFSFSSSFKRFT